MPSSNYDHWQRKWNCNEHSVAKGCEYVYSYIQMTLKNKELKLASLCNLPHHLFSCANKYVEGIAHKLFF